MDTNPLTQWRRLREQPRTQKKWNGRLQLLTAALTLLLIHQSFNDERAIANQCELDQTTQESKQELPVRVEALTARIAHDYLAERPSIEISQVAVSSIHVTLQVEAKASLDKDELARRQWGVVELGPEQHAASTTGPFSEDKVMPIEFAKSNLATFRLPRDSDNRDRLYSQWIVVEKSEGNWHRVSHARFATSIASDEKYANVKPIEAKSIKGLNGIHPDPRLFSDLADLKVGHIGVNMILSGLMERNPGEGSVEFQYEGNTYWFSSKTLQQFDRLLTFAQANDIVVSAIILVPCLDRTDQYSAEMTHPDAVSMKPNGDGGHYSMANVTSNAGAMRYVAAIRFLAERYSGLEGAPGKISNWIIHNEVDSGWIWTNAGERDVDSYMADYHKSMRLSYLAARSIDPHARVFISLTHFWNQAHLNQPLRYYKGRDVLDRLAEWTRVEGEFEWGVAHHPYPTNLFDVRIWEDSLPTDNVDTPVVTFRNLSVLEDYLAQPQFLYSPENAEPRPRSIMLSEQGFHTKDDSIESQQLQAAALVYAWNRIKETKTVEAFHYHRWIDHEKEGGLNLGLWTVEPGSITWPATKKLSWNVFQSLGTDQEQAETEFAKSILREKE